MACSTQMTITGMPDTCAQLVHCGIKFSIALLTPLQSLAFRRRSCVNFPGVLFRSMAHAFQDHQFILDHFPPVLAVQHGQQHKLKPFEIGGQGGLEGEVIVFHVDVEVRKESKRDVRVLRCRKSRGLRVPLVAYVVGPTKARYIWVAISGKQLNLGMTSKQMLKREISL